MLTRLSSRKFMLAVGGTIALLGAGQWTEAVGVITAYLLAEAGVDATRVVKSGREVLDTVESESAAQGS